MVDPRQWERVTGNPRRRMARVRLAMILAVVGMLVPSGIIQLVEHAHWAKQSNYQTIQTRVLPALRGGIYDRYGSALAISRPTYRVIADPQIIDDPKKRAKVIAPFVHIPLRELTRRLSNKSRGYDVLSNSVSVDDGRVLLSLRINGLDIYDSTDRSAPNGFLARSLIGSINDSGIGSAGLETQYQSLLAGRSGLEQVPSSLSKHPLPGATPLVKRKAVPGIGIELTVDTALQFITEQTLGKQVQATHAYTGVAIVMDVRTGEILASASLVNKTVSSGALTPVTDWGHSIGVPGIRQTIMNLGITQVYLPGSVFKVVPFSAALERNIITPASAFSVPYSIKVGTKVFHDAERHGVEHLTATDILSQSSNIGTYLISRQVGKDALLSQVHDLGFGSMTALNYPGETPGVLKTATTWSQSDIGSLPIGQVNAVTPLQVLDCYNAIANDGVFIEPKVVRAKVYPDGSLVATKRSAHRRVMSTRVAQQLNAMLQQVVSRGTGTSATILGYKVAGKTGTSQIPFPGTAKFISGAYNATFVGFAPANHPVLSMIVVVQRPQSSIFGGVVAAPVFQRVMTYALQHYNIPASGGTQTTKPGSASYRSDVT